MYLFVSATEIEMEPLRDLLVDQPMAALLVAGVGPLETAHTLTRFLEANRGVYGGVVNFGVGGGYTGTGLKLLDICLADVETYADLGICYGTQTETFSSEHLPVNISWQSDRDLHARAGEIFKAHGIPFDHGNFNTVGAVSGTLQRGIFLRDRWTAICENMEGAAVARVCEAFDLPWLEVRCISNLVEDHDPESWELAEACRKSAEVAALLGRELSRSL